MYNLILECVVLSSLLTHIPCMMLSPLQLQIDHSRININIHLTGDMQLKFIANLPSFFRLYKKIMLREVIFLCAFCFVL